MRYGKRVLLLSAAARAAPLLLDDDPPSNRSFSYEEIEDGLHCFQTSPERPVLIDAYGDTSAFKEGTLIFLAPHDGGIPEPNSGALIVTPEGEPVWSSSAYGMVHNLLVQPWGPDSAPHLTFWAGARDTGAYSRGEGHGVVLDSSYAEVARIYLPESVDARDVDLHEFRTSTWRDTGRRTAVVGGVRTTKSEIGNGWAPYVQDTCAWEFDVETEEVLWHWCPADQIGQDESYQMKLVTGWTSWAPYDFFHLNTIEKDAMGNYLISGRCTHAIYLVAPSGDIIWTLGGHAAYGHGDFEVEEGSGDVSFGWQHHTSFVPDLVQPGEEGRVRYISLFDNGNSGFLLLATRKTSRGMIVRIDEEEMTVSLVGAYDPPSELEGDPSSSQGAIQYLPATGDVFVSFGKKPWYALYAIDGEMKMASRMALEAETYRAVLYPWQGRPSYPPSIGVSIRPNPSSEGTSTVTDVYVSWNGETHVSTYRLLGGSTPSSLLPIFDAPKAGFETILPVPPWSTAEWLAVAALDETGEELKRSKAHRASINSTLPRLPAGSAASAATFGPPSSLSVGWSGRIESLGSILLLVQRWVVDAAKGLGLYS